MALPPGNWGGASPAATGSSTNAIFDCRVGSHIFQVQSFWLCWVRINITAVSGALIK